MMITLTIYFTGVRAEPAAELEEEQLEVEEHPEEEEQPEEEEKLEEPEERLKNMIQKAVKRLAISKECRGTAWFKCAFESLKKAYNTVKKVAKAFSTGHESSGKFRIKK